MTTIGVQQKQLSLLFSFFFSFALLHSFSLSIIFISFLCANCFVLVCMRFSMHVIECEEMLFLKWCVHFFGICSISFSSALFVCSFFWSFGWLLACLLGLSFSLYCTLWCKLCSRAIFSHSIYRFISLVILFFILKCHCRWSVQNAPKCLKYLWQMEISVCIALLALYVSVYLLCVCTFVMVSTRAIHNAS